MAVEKVVSNFSLADFNALLKSPAERFKDTGKHLLGKFLGGGMDDETEEVSDLAEELPNLNHIGPWGLRRTGKWRPTLVSSRSTDETTTAIYGWNAGGIFFSLLFGSWRGIHIIGRPVGSDLRLTFKSDLEQNRLRFFTIMFIGLLLGILPGIAVIIYYFYWRIYKSRRVQREIEEKVAPSLVRALERRVA